MPRVPSNKMPDEKFNYKPSKKERIVIERNQIKLARSHLSKLHLRKTVGGRGIENLKWYAGFLQKRQRDGKTLTDIQVGHMNEMEKYFKEKGIVIDNTQHRIIIDGADQNTTQSSIVVDDDMLSSDSESEIDSASMVGQNLNASSSHESVEPESTDNQEYLNVVNDNLNQNNNQYQSNALDLYRMYQSIIAQSYLRSLAQQSQQPNMSVASQDQQNEPLDLSVKKPHAVLTLENSNHEQAMQNSLANNANRPNKKDQKPPVDPEIAETLRNRIQFGSINSAFKPVKRLN